MSNIVPNNWWLHPKKKLTPKQQKSLKDFFAWVSYSSDITSTHIKALLAADIADIATYIPQEQQEVFLHVLGNAKTKNKLIRNIRAFASYTWIASTWFFLYSTAYTTVSSFVELALALWLWVWGMTVSLVASTVVLDKMRQSLRDNLFDARFWEKTVALQWYGFEEDTIEYSFVNSEFDENVYLLIQHQLSTPKWIKALEKIFDKKHSVAFLQQIVDSNKSASEKITALKALKTRDEDNSRSAPEFEVLLLEKDFKANKSLWGRFSKLKNRLR